MYRNVVLNYRRSNHPQNTSDQHLYVIFENIVCKITAILLRFRCVNFSDLTHLYCYGDYKKYCYWIETVFGNCPHKKYWGTFSRHSATYHVKLCPDWHSISKPWRHNGRDSISNQQPHDCLLNRLFKHRSKKTSKLRVTGLCVVNSPGTGEFPAQMASNAENISICWRHHVPAVFSEEWWHFSLETHCCDWLGLSYCNKLEWIIRLASNITSESRNEAQYEMYMKIKYQYIEASKRLFKICCLEGLIILI